MNVDEEADVLRFEVRNFLLLLFGLLIAWGERGVAQTEFAAGQFIYEGQLLDTADVPLAGPVDITVEVLNQAETCVLYAEKHFSIVLDNGFFSVAVGSGSLEPSDPGLSMAEVFANDSTPVVPSHATDCPGGNPVIGVNESRYLRVTIDDGTDIETLSPNQLVAAIPAALRADEAKIAEEALTLDGMTSSAFVQNAGNVTQSKVDDLSSQHTELMALAGGTSVQYVTSGGNVGANLIYSADQMAVGTATPDTGVEFEIEKNDPTLRLSATDGGAGSMEIQFQDTAGTDQASISVQEGTDALTLSTAGTSALVLDAAQNASFQSSLTVAGTIRGGIYMTSQEGSVLLPALMGCGAACAGTQWMNSDLDEIRYWDGAAIRSVASYSGSLGANGQVLTSNGPGAAPTWQAAVMTDATKLPLAGGTMSGNIIMGGNLITGLGTPTGAGDAVNKTYVDQKLVGEDLAAPLAAQDQQSIRWNNGSNQWEYYTPPSAGVASISATVPFVVSGTAANPNLGLLSGDGLDIDGGGRLEVNLSSDLQFNSGQIEIAANAVDGTALANQSVALGHLDGSGAGSNQSIRRNSSNTAFEYYTPLDNSSAFVNNGNIFGSTARLGTTDGFPLDLMSGGTTYMRMTPAGAIGFGTTSPSAPFHFSSGMLRLDGSGAYFDYRPDGSTCSGGEVLAWDAGNQRWDCAPAGAGGDFMADGSVPMSNPLRSVAGTAAAPGMTFVGDTDTGIYQPSANQLGFSVLGIERLKIDNFGDVVASLDDSNRFGVGTNQPAGKFHVTRGSVNGSVRMVVGTDGNSGADEARLDIMTYGGQGPNALGQLSTNGWSFIGKGNSGGNSNDLRLSYFQDFSVTPAMHMKSTSGFIGLNEDDPEVRLEVNGEIKLGMEVTGSSCNTQLEGTQRYNSVLKTMEYCNGDIWQGMTGLTSCPPGWEMIGDAGVKTTYCVEQINRPPERWSDAKMICSTLVSDSAIRPYGQPRLCGHREWMVACEESGGGIGLPNAEWVDELVGANGGDGDAVLTGNGDCQFIDERSTTSNREFRCCL